MDGNWTGRYHDLVTELVKHTNITLKGTQIKRDLAGKGILFTPQVWQVMEYIIEHNYEEFIMIDMSDALQIPQSTFSKIVNYLVTNGLVEKYQKVGNKKNIILKPTKLALEIYNANVRDMEKANFQNFFKALDSISDEDIAKFVEALRIHNRDLMKYDSVDTDDKQDAPLIKIEK